MSPMPGSLSQTPFDPTFTQSHLMKLFPGGCPSMTSMTSMAASASHQSASSPANIFRATNTPSGLHPGLPQSYPAEFSNYGPMYTSYYAKQAQAMAANHPSSR